MSENSSRKPLRVLSLDGGGMRGIYTAAFLERICEQQAKIRGVKGLDFGKGFNLIVGTSTGAIVACALAIGCPLKKVVEMYRFYGAKIFPYRINRFPNIFFRILSGSEVVKKGDIALKKALTAILGNKTLADVFENRGISLSIPTVHMSSYQSRVFKKTPVSGVRDENFMLVDICMATSAAPIYRSLAAIYPPGNHDESLIFADGGLWANNPILVAFVDALKMTENEHDRPIEIFSLGTCPRPEGEYIPGDSRHRSVYDWKFGASIAPLSISAQEFAYDNIARFLAFDFNNLGRDIRIVRFPRKEIPAEMMSFLDLDDTRDEAYSRLISQAGIDADLTKSACDDENNNDGKLIKSLLQDLPEFEQDID